MKINQFEVKKAFFQRKLGLGEHRQFQIMEMAMELIEKRGFEQLQFGDLAKKCKVSRALIHHYFKDKYDLADKLLDLSTLHLQRYVQAALEETQALYHFETYCRATLDWAVVHRAEATGLFLFL